MNGQKVFSCYGDYFFDVALAEADAFIETHDLSFRERVLLTAIFSDYFSPRP